MARDRLELDVGDNARLYGNIRSLDSFPLPPGVTLDLPNRESTKTDAYGVPLRYIFAGELSMVSRDGFTGSIDGYTTAVFSFLMALPTDTMVVLYWH